MQTVESFKLQSLTNTYIREKYAEIFTKRFEEETGGPWSSCAMCGESLANKFDIDTNSDSGVQLLTDDEMVLIKCGNLDKFTFNILSILLSYTKYKNLTKERIAKENKIIQKIFYLVNSNNLDCIGIQEALELKNQFVGHLNELLCISGANSKANDNGGGGAGGYLEIIREELDYLLDTQQLDTQKNINQENKESEEHSNRMSKIGDDHYSNERYVEAGSYYRCALGYFNLSNYTKSILYFKIAMAEINEIKQLESNFMFVNSGSLLDCFSLNGDVCGVNFKIDGIVSTLNKAIILRPSCSKPYYQLGLIHYKQANFEKAIDLFEASLALEESEESKNIVQLEIDRVKSILVVERSDGNRDFEKEARLALYSKYQFLQILKDQFKSNLDEDTTKALSNTKVRDYIDLLKSDGIPKKKALEYYFLGYNEFNHKLIGSGSQHSNPYYTVAADSNDNNLKMALMIKVSTLPVPFSVRTRHLSPLFTLNTTVGFCCEVLGKVYLHGLLDNHIDPKRAKYYFEKSISIYKMIQAERISEHNFPGYSFLGLGHLYYSGKLQDESGAPIFDKENAIRIWSQGLKMEGVLLRRQLLKQISLVSTNDHLSGPRKNYFGVPDPTLQDTLDQVQKSMDGGSVYSKQAFQVLSTVVNITKSFGNETHLEISSLPLDQKIELVKPLADIYCLIDMMEVVLFPNIYRYQLGRFVKDLYNQVPDNQIVSLLLILHHGMELRDIQVNQSNLKEIFDFTRLLDTDKAQQVSQESPDQQEKQQQKSSFSNQYEQAIIYFKCCIGVQHHLKETFKPLLKFAANPGNSFMFNYLVLLTIFFFEEAYGLLNKDQILQHYNRALSIISTLPKDHPILTSYHVAMAGVLSKLYSNNKNSNNNNNNNNINNSKINNVNKKSKKRSTKPLKNQIQPNQEQLQQILFHFNQSLECFSNTLDYVAPRSKPFVSNYFQTLLDIEQFKQLLSKDQINQVVYSVIEPFSDGSYGASKFAAGINHI